MDLDHSYASIERIEAVHRERLIADERFRVAVQYYLGDTLIARLGAGTWDFSTETETVGEQVVHLKLAKPFQPQLALARFLAFAESRAAGPSVLRDETARWDHAYQQAELDRLLALPERPVDLAKPPRIEGLEAPAYREVIFPIARSIGTAYAAARKDATWRLGRDPTSDTYGKLLMPGWTIFDTIHKGLARGSLAELVEDQLARARKRA